MALATITAKELQRMTGFTYDSKAAQAVATKINAIITAIGAIPNYGAPVADLTALAAVAAADRADGQVRVVESNGLGGESVYVFSAASTASADGINIVAPAAGTGRWILASQANAGVTQVANVTAGTIAKGTAVYVTGYHAALGRLTVAAADSTNVGKTAIGVVLADIAAGNVTPQAGAVIAKGSLASSGLDTSAGPAVGDPVYYSNTGALTVTPPSTPQPQVIARVVTLAASATLAVDFEPLPPIGLGSSATTACAGNDARLSDSRAPTGAAAGDLAGTYPNPTIGAGKATGIKQAFEAALAPANDHVDSAAGVISTAFASKYTVPTGRFGVGMVIRIRAGGRITTGGAGGGSHLQLTLKIGTVVVGLQTASLAVATNDFWSIEADIVMAAVGAGGSFNAWTNTWVGHFGAGTQVNAYATNNASALDTTADRDVTVLVDWDAGAGNSVRLDVLDVQVVGP